MSLKATYLFSQRPINLSSTTVTAAAANPTNNINGSDKPEMTTL
jgi:hypothetical protein